MLKNKSLIALIDECLDLAKSNPKWKKHDFNYALVNIKVRLNEIKERVESVNKTLIKANNLGERVFNNEQCDKI